MAPVRRAAHLIAPIRGLARRAATLPSLVIHVSERLLDRVARLALAFDIIYMVVHAWPAFVGAALGSITGARADHHVLALGVVVRLPVAVGVARRERRHAVEGPVAADRILEFVAGRGFEGFGVGVLEGVERGAERGVVARVEGRVVGAGVVVCLSVGTESVEGVDLVGLNVVFARHVGGFVGDVFLTGKEGEGLVGFVAGEAFVERRAATAAGGGGGVGI